VLVSWLPKGRRTPRGLHRVPTDPTRAEHTRLITALLTVPRAAQLSLATGTEEILRWGVEAYDLRLKRRSMAAWRVHQVYRQVGLNTGLVPDAGGIWHC
jgi:hypothetical protein